jgi:hypothetical protein
MSDDKVEVNRKALITLLARHALFYEGYYVQNMKVDDIDAQIAMAKEMTIMTGNLFSNEDDTTTRDRISAESIQERNNILTAITLIQHVDKEIKARNN